MGTTGTHIIPRKGTRNLYARIIIPADLREALGRDEIQKSLKTADMREAKKRAAPVFAEWLTQFDALRRKRSVTPEDIQRAAYAHYEDELDRDEFDRKDIARRLALKAAEIGRVKAEIASGVKVHAGHLLDLAMVDDPQGSDRRMRALRRCGIEKAMSDAETSAVHWIADLVIQRENLDIAKGSSEYLTLCRYLQRAELEALKRADERDRFDFAGKPTDPAIQPLAASQKALKAKPGETILELFETFYRQKAGRSGEDTWNQNRLVIGLFADYLGRSSHVTAITRKAVSEWKKQLMLWPARAAQINAFDGLDFKAVIAKNVSERKPVIVDKTINRYLSGVAPFFEWLLVEEHIEVDVMRGQYLDLDRKRKVVFPYSDAQAATIFASPIFTGCLSDKKEHLPGSHIVRDWRYWVPILSLYHGARLGELCQLLTADVKQIGATWVMHITTEGDDEKSTKTDGSQRVVPLHPKVIELGFLDFHAECAKARQPRLFPQVERDGRNHFGDASRFFNRYLTRIGVKIDKRHNFHSLRHGIADAFRRAGYRDEEFAPLLGHVKATTTARYGVLREGELSKLKAMIDAVYFEGVFSL